MNSDSHLKYPVMFAGGKREVILSGEAYFDVVKDKSAPFIVRTESGNIEVLGTEFNIKCYSDETALVTTLVNGKVKFDDGINHTWEGCYMNEHQVAKVYCKGVELNVQKLAKQKSIGGK